LVYVSVLKTFSDQMDLIICFKIKKKKWHGKANLCHEKSRSGLSLEVDSALKAEKEMWGG